MLKLSLTKVSMNMKYFFQISKYFLCQGVSRLNELVLTQAATWRSFTPRLVTVWVDTGYYTAETQNMEWWLSIILLLSYLLSIIGAMSVNVSI